MPTVGVLRYPNLFDDLDICGLHLQNRIVMAPMGTGFDIYSDRARAYYAERARGGAGLIITGVADDRLFDDSSILEALGKLPQRIHEEGSKVVIQITARHGRIGVEDAVEPSATAGARQAAVEEIWSIITHYARSAGRAKDIGFDGMEIHGCHGFFISRFFSPATNHRTDEYGGTTGKRTRFALELVEAVRQQVGDDFPVFYRLSAYEDIPGGVTLDESVSLAIGLEEVGVDAIDVSAGTSAGLTIKGSIKTGLVIPDATYPFGTHADEAHAIKRRVGVPVIAVGRIHRPDVAEHILSQRKADLVAIGRQLIADPHWPKKVMDGKEEEIVPCLSCNTQCVTARANGVKPLACMQNPKAGLEYEVP